MRIAIHPHTPHGHVNFPHGHAHLHHHILWTLLAFIVMLLLLSDRIAGAIF